MTYFYRELPDLIREGHLYLAVPPLFRLSRGAKVFYARDDAHKDQIMANELKGSGKVEVSRFKGLGEMPVNQLKETTMNPETRTLLQVEIAEDAERETLKRVESLMGRKPELRFKFIQEHASEVRDLDV